MENQDPAEKERMLADAKVLLEMLETDGGKVMLKLIDDTIKGIPSDVTDFIGVGAGGMSLDTVRVAFSAGGRAYLMEIPKRIQELRDFVKRVAVENSSKT